MDEMQSKVIIIGQKCRQARRASDITLQQLSCMCNYTQANLSLFENGQNRNMGILAFYLDVFPELYDILKEALK